MKDEPHQAICMEKHLEAAWVGLKVWVDKASRNHHGQINSVNKVDGDSDRMPTYWLWGGAQAYQRNNGLFQHLRERYHCPSSHPGTGKFNFSPCASGAFQAAASVLELRGSEFMEVHVGSFKRNWYS